MSKISETIKTHQWYILSSCLFLGIYTAISIIRHYTFHSNAFDLGIFNQTLYSYAHLKLGPNTLRGISILLGDHFEPILFLFAPLYWVFGSYTLLIVQIGFVMLGGLGTYLLLMRETKNEKLSITGSILLFLSFGLLQAMAYDYHNNVIGAMLIPWLFYFIKTKNFRWYYIILVLFLMTKENLALMTVLLGISIMIFEDKETKKHGLITTLVSTIYFIAILKIIIPALNHGTYDHWSYFALGSSPGEAIKHIILHPFTSLSLLFDDELKIKMWAIALASGGIFCIIKPKYGLLLLPIMAQKFFSSDKLYWGYTFQYSVELASVIPIATIICIYQIKDIKKRWIIVGLMIIINIVIVSRMTFYDGTKMRDIFSSKYYAPLENKESLNEAIKLMETNASLSTQNTITAHLAGRDVIYQFPIIKDSKYILLNLGDSHIWPIKNMEEFIELKKRIDIDIRYEKIYEKNNILLYKKHDSN